MATNQSKQEIWKEHVARASDHPGGVMGYCKSAGITASGYYYWRDKLSGKKKVRRSVKRFLPVVTTEQVIQEIPKESNRPNAQWVGQLLAAFVRELS